MTSPTALMTSAAGRGNTSATDTTSTWYTTATEMPFRAYSPSATSTASAGLSATNCGSVPRSITPHRVSTPSTTASEAMASTGA